MKTIYLGKDFIPTEKKSAIMAKVIPGDNLPPFFIILDKTEKEKVNENSKGVSRSR